jgi:four helix bundle protein
MLQLRLQRAGCGMQDFKRLRVWHKAHACFLDVHQALKPELTRDVAGLRGQAVRAAASIPTNIAEGCGKASSRELVRFLDIATGSARELENHLIVARDLEVITEPQFAKLDDQLDEVRRMLSGLVRALRAQEPRVR